MNPLKAQSSNNGRPWHACAEPDPENDNKVSPKEVFESDRPTQQYNLTAVVFSLLVRCQIPRVPDFSDCAFQAHSRFTWVVVCPIEMNFNLFLV